MPVNSFSVPVNRTGNKITRASNGMLCAGEEFDMQATFSGDGPGSEDCACYEYRQEVRGTFKINGRVVPHYLPSGFLDPRGWLEDGDPLASYGPHYGHRSEQGAVDDQYLPARADGCKYRGHDFPQLGGNNGDRFEIDLEFRGLVLDSCHGADNVVESVTWQVQFTGRLR